MNDNLPVIELPAFATTCERLANAVEVSREAVSLRVGFEVEMSSIEPVAREGETHLRVRWRRKPPPLRVIEGQAGALR
jgi:hypothetical protein